MIKCILLLLGRFANDILPQLHGAKMGSSGKEKNDFHQVASLVKLGGGECLDWLQRASGKAFTSVFEIKMLGCVLILFLYSMQRLLLLVLLLFFYGMSFAQHISYKHYSVADKLPSNICYRILQDEKGFIWVATEKGIALFDGYKFKPLQTKNKLLNLDIWGLFMDDDYRIWLKSKQNQFNYIYKDSVYNLNAGQQANDQLAVFSNYSSMPLIFKNKPNDPFIYFLHEGKAPSQKKIPALVKEKILHGYGAQKLVAYNLTRHFLFLLFAEGEIIQYDFQTGKSIYQHYHCPIVSLMHTKGVTHNQPNRFYFSVKDSIFCITQNKIQFVNTYFRSGIPKDAVFVGVSGKNILYRQNTRLFAVDSTLKPVVFNLPDIQANVSQVYEDTEHNLWLVTIGNGVYFVSNKNLQNRVYQKENGLLDNHILSLSRDASNRIYLGYYNQEGFQQLRNDSLITIPKGAGIASNLITLDGGDFMVSDQYVSKKPIQVKCNFNNTRITKIKDVSYYITHFAIAVKSICKIDEQTVLIGARNILIRLTKKDQVIYLDSMATLDASIYAVAPLQQSILLGTTDGLYRYSNQKVEYLGQAHPNLRGNIRAILVDEKKHIWITSDNGNLNCYDTSFKLRASFPKFTGLVTALSQDTFAHTILASSSDGLYVIAMNEPHAYRTYSIADGLPSNEVNAAISDEINYYVATSSGLSIIKRNTTHYAYTPLLYCTHLFVNNKTCELATQYQLNYNQNSIRLELATISYQSLGAIEYYYRFKNLNNLWTLTKQPQIEFSSLKPGAYELEIFAKDVNGISTLNTLQITFNIVPPFWKTTWFYTLMSVLFVGGLFYIFYWWLQRGKRKALQEANLKKEFAEIKLNALQSQLNSHFVYNSLNAIQNFILNKDEITANEYMSKFAKLIRLFLESSRNKQAPLEREIELITLYTSLEKLRFDEKFDVLIDSSGIKNTRIDFPTNMIQPFIENAIVHGLFHKAEKGLLQIVFTETETDLICRVEDDGVGRAKSAEINRNRKRKSMGMDIIHDKIVNIGNLYGQSIHIEIIDKTVNTHSNTGTIVMIRYKK